jgi:hypothetical protein
MKSQEKVMRKSRNNNTNTGFKWLLIAIAFAIAVFTVRGETSAVLHIVDKLAGIITAAK